MEDHLNFFDCEYTSASNTSTSTTSTSLTSEHIDNTREFSLVLNSSRYRDLHEHPLPPALHHLLHPQPPNPLWSRSSSFAISTPPPLIPVNPVLPSDLMDRDLAVPRDDHLAMLRAHLNSVGEYRRAEDALLDGLRHAAASYEQAANVMRLFYRPLLGSLIGPAAFLPLSVPIPSESAFTEARAAHFGGVVSGMEIGTRVYSVLREGGENWRVRLMRAYFYTILYLVAIQHHNSHAATPIEVPAHIASLFESSVAELLADNATSPSTSDSSTQA